MEDRKEEFFRRLSELSNETGFVLDNNLNVSRVHLVASSVPNPAGCYVYKPFQGMVWEPRTGPAGLAGFWEGTVPYRHLTPEEKEQVDAVRECRIDTFMERLAALSREVGIAIVPDYWGGEGVTLEILTDVERDGEYVGPGMLEYRPKDGWPTKTKIED